MNQTKTGPLPSRGEVAFRFLACTGIALALYYTPELKWSPDAATAQADVTLTAPVPEPSLEACAGRDNRDLLIDAAMRAN